jgi:hypothetical protein
VRGLGRAVAAVALALAAVAIGLAVANRESITGPDDANAIQASASWAGW